jgi:hypothetical protein
VGRVGEKCPGRARTGKYFANMGIGEVFSGGFYLTSPAPKQACRSGEARQKLAF